MHPNYPPSSWYLIATETARDANCSRGHRSQRSFGPRGSTIGCPLISPFPVDHIVQRLAVEIGAQIGAEEIDRAADVAESRRRRLARLRVAPCADDPHAECRAQPADVAADAAGTDDARGLALDQQRPIGAMIENAFGAVDGSAMQAFGKIQ